MALSDKLVSQFAKLTNTKEESKNESIVYGTVFKQGDSDFVKIDGADTLTPVISTMVIKDGDRVTVMIKNHKAIVTGNITSPGAQSSDLDDIVDEITEVEILIADKVSTDEFDAEKGRIDDLITDTVLIKDKLTANEAEIDDIIADNVVINEKLTAVEAEIDNLIANKLDVEIADITYATIDSLEATDAKINNLQATYGEFEILTTNKFSSIEANIKKLESEQITVTELEAKFANVDFSNIGQAAIENLFTESGLIKDLVVSSGTITGELVGVTIKGDLIEGGTVIADKLVVKGTDGLYYKLNTDGVKTEAEQTEYNSLNGRVITAKSITATKISVDDLVAFGATIGGFNITTESLYSGVKNSVSNTTRGIFMDKTGQFSIGDAFNFVRYFKDTDGQFKLDMSISNLKIGIENKPVIINTENQFYQSTSPTSLKDGEWSLEQPKWEDGKYIWLRTFVTYTDGTSGYSPSETGICISGNTGMNGENGENGRGIKTTEITYQVSSSQDEPPDEEWSIDIPKLNSSKPYLWTRIIITYTDDTQTTYYNVSSTLDSIEIGGRNLLVGTKDFSGFDIYNGVEYITDESGFTYAKFSANDTDAMIWISSHLFPIPKENVWNNEVILSFEIRGNEEWSPSDSTKTIVMEFAVCDSETTSRKKYKLVYLNEKVTTEWSKHSVKAMINDGYISSGTGDINLTTRFWVRFYNTSEYEVHLRKIKLEIGTIVTDWSPAPEDTDSAITAATMDMATRTDITDMSTQIEAKIDGLQVSVEETYTSKSETAQQKEDLLKAIKSEIDISAGGILAEFEDIEKRVTDVDGELKEDVDYTKGFIKAGVLFFESADINGMQTSIKKIGVAIGQNLGKATIIDPETGEEIEGIAQQGLYSVFTADRLSFYQNTSEVAYISNEKLYIKKAEIFEGYLKIGKWLINTESNYWNLEWEG